jgi:hypothetical protein
MLPLHAGGAGRQILARSGQDFLRPGGPLQAGSRPSALRAARFSLAATWAWAWSR